MNYRHAFHAGNFADVHKHSVLARILMHLRGKGAAFRVIDTHAGAAGYDLAGSEARRSGEWRDGIGRLWQAELQAGLRKWLEPYLEAVAAVNPEGGLQVYPGSPLIARRLLRPQDRLIACELEPKAAAALARAVRGDRRAKAIAIDGWRALGAFVPPKERRGIVFVDPPYEDAADFRLLPEALSDALRKWPTGIYMFWYPIKDRVAPDALSRRLRRLAVPNILRSELTLGAPRSQGGLLGSGLIVVNPPFPLQPDLRKFLPELARLLSPAAMVRTDWLPSER